jgi:hypothetical protein
VQAFADEIGISFLETSAKESINVEEAFLAMSAAIKKRYGREVSDLFSSTKRGYPDGTCTSLQQSWESGSLGEETLQSSSDERPANSAAATAAKEQMLFDMKAHQTCLPCLTGIKKMVYLCVSLPDLLSSDTRKKLKIFRCCKHIS